MGWHSVGDTHRYYYLLFIIRLYVSYIAFLFLSFFFDKYNLETSHAIPLIVFRNCKMRKVVKTISLSVLAS